MNKVYMVKYDNGREFEYSLFNKLEDAVKERRRYYCQYWFEELEEGEIEREGEYRINDIYGSRIDLQEVKVN